MDPLRHRLPVRFRLRRRPGHLPVRPPVHRLGECHWPDLRHRDRRHYRLHARPPRPRKAGQGRRNLKGPRLSGASTLKGGVRYAGTDHRKPRDNRRLPGTGGCRRAHHPEPL